MLPLAAALVSASCGETPTPPHQPVVERLEVFATDSAVLVGHLLELRVAAWDSQGVPVSPARMEWRSTNPAALAVDSLGVAHAIGGGDVLVYAWSPPSTAVDSMPVHVAVHGELKWRLALDWMPMTGGLAEGPDGTLYVIGRTVPSADVSTLYAISPRGEVRWSRPVSEVTENWPLVASDRTVYLVGHYVYAINADGSLRWSVTSRPPNDPGNPEGHTGAVSKQGVLYAAMGYDLLALGAATGDTLWVGPRANDGGWLPPASISADGRRVYISNTGDSLYALDAGTGSVRWAVPHADMGFVAFDVGTAISGGELFAPGAFRLLYVDTGGTLLAVGPRYGRGVSEPAIGPDGTLYVQRPQGYGVFAYSDVAHERWRLAGVESRYTWYGGPALAEGGVLYAAALDGFYALDLSPGGATVRWRFPSDPRDSLIFIGAPLIGRDGTVYSFTSTTFGKDVPPPSSDEVFAFWEDKRPEPNSPWPMWRHDARRSGQAHR